MKKYAKAPDFILYDQNNNVFRLYDNLDQPLVIVFYPKDETIVCTRQLCEYNLNLEKFSMLGYRLIGISTDTQASHKEFSKERNLQFSILSDENKEVCRKYDALNFTGRCKRKIIVVNKDKNIVFEDTLFSFLYRKNKKLLKVLRALKR